MIAMIALLCQLSAPSWGWKSVSEQTKECHAFYSSCLLKRAYAHVSAHRDTYVDKFIDEVLTVPTDLGSIRAASALSETEIQSFLVGCAAERGGTLAAVSIKPPFDPKKPYQIVPQKRPTLDEIFSDKDEPNRDSEILKKYGIKKPD